MSRPINRILYWYRRYLRRSPFGWSGNYNSWQEAAQKCTGYDSEQILEKVKAATLKVKSGKAEYERDSVLFDTIEYSWPLLSSLMWVAAQNNGSLKVMDFGGSLGSSYFQNRKFLKSLQQVSWNVIEQKNFVDCGRQFMQDEQLQFFPTPEACIGEKGLPHVLVISCTLPYLEKPYLLLDQLLNLNIPCVVVDNTFFNFAPADRITIQKVPPSIYEASYPCWFLDYEKVKEKVQSKYQIISEHVNDTIIHLDGQPVPYRGFIAARKN